MQVTNILIKTLQMLIFSMVINFRKKDLHLPTLWTSWFDRMPSAGYI